MMTDFGRVRAITVPATVSMDYASERMRVNGVHLLLVTDERNTIVGLITSTDIDGERPLVHMRQFAMRREELSVADIMTPSERIEVIEMADVMRARVGHVVATSRPSAVSTRCRRSRRQEALYCARAFCSVAD